MAEFGGAKLKFLRRLLKLEHGTCSRPYWACSTRKRSIPRSTATLVAALAKGGVMTAKLKRAGWDDEFLLKLLSQMH
jgi:hypothetical protein